MQELALFALIGLGTGSLYSLTSQGLIVIYRGSGVLNFAQGVMGCIGAYVAWQLHTESGVSWGLAFAIGVACSALLGVITYVCIMRPLRTASPLARVVATLGVLTILQTAVIIRYGTQVTIVPSELPTIILHITDTITISSDRLILVGIAALVSVGLTFLYTRTKFGIATTAVTENQRAASSLGLSPDGIAVGNWALGAGLAGAAAILISPIIQLQVATMTQLMLAALAAALLARFQSFSIAFWASIGIGVLQSLLQNYVSTPGVASSVPFAIVIIWLIITGRGLPLRDFFLQRLPSVGSGRIRWVPVAVAVVALCLVIAFVPATWQVALTTTLGTALILLSIVVLTGYTGQISLAQYAIAGIGAFISGRLVSTIHLPFPAALIIGVLGTIPIGLIFAVPAVRTRGINLAIMTVGLGSAIELLLFDSTSLTGGYAGTPVAAPSIFGLSLDPITHPSRYAYMAVVLYMLFTLIVANVRRGRSGRRMLAVRTNERAAASLGISVKGAKLYSFGLASAIAATGGIILAFEATNITYTSFTSFISITFVAFAFVGGIGYLGGPLIGATFASGTVGAQILNTLFPGSGAANYLQLVGGAFLVITVLWNQDGAMHENIAIFWRLWDRIAPRSQERRRTAAAGSVAMAGDERVGPIQVPPRTLTLRDITVRFGGVVAVDGVSFTVQPGSVFGLIGPNGAGKTTVIDAATGFVRPSHGTIRLDGKELTRESVTYRARSGINRTFQSLELFEDMTVLENIRAACDERDARSYVVDLVHPVNPGLPSEAMAAIREFNLESHLTTRIDQLPYGQRRLVAIARALATRPSILLLDEPASGLSSAESLELARLVRRLPDEWGIGVLLVEHDMDFVMSICDEILVLEFGREIARGLPGQIRNNPAVIAAYLGNEVDQVGPAPGDLPTQITPSVLGNSAS